MKLNYLGVPVYMAGKNYYIPSLSYPDFKANYEFLASKPDLEGPKILEYFDKLVPIIGMAIRRNYPEIEDWQLGAMLDITTLHLGMSAVQNASGLKPVSETPEGE